MSITDDLTQVFNRRHFHVRLDEEIARASRYGHPVTLLMMDIDHFKLINDRYGHQTGDEVLKTIGSILRSNTRSADIADRMVKMADDAMYQAYQAGRNRVVVYSGM